MLQRTDFNLSRQKTLRLLDELEAAAGPGWTLCLPPGITAAGITERLKEIPAPIPEIDTGRLSGAATGAALFWGDSGRYLIRPPFPIKEELSAAGCHAAPLRRLLEKEHTVALILVRLGAYGVGLFQGEKLLRSKVGTGLVHARHKKGGSSAGRFARHREKQAETFFSRVCAHLRDKIEPDLSGLDFVIYGGEKHTLASFRQQCAFTKQLDGRTLNYLLNVREPKQAALLAAIGDAWSSRVSRWQWVE